MTRSVIALSVVFLALAVGEASAQRPTRPRPNQRPGQRPPVQTPRDTGRARPTGRIQPGEDSSATARDTSMHWSEPDSVMQTLLEKPGYTVTRYEGDMVIFDALAKALTIANAGVGRARVEREGQRVVTDSSIIYNDRTRDVLVGGHFEISLGQDQPPIAGFGTARYNLAQRSGRLTNATVTVEESGERWFITSAIGKTALGDTTRGIPTRFYGVGGSLTSCDDTIPDYHFALREIKRTDRTLVARPAVLYIQDIPVMWLPFVFQDIRPGRRSGILPPRFGASDIVRNNPAYHRHVENLGYYFALNDYMDATTWIDWRSAAGGDSLDPGWYRLNGEWSYSWLSRFMSGRLATSYTRQHDRSDNTAISWNHQERFGRSRNVSASVNYVTSTRLQRQNTFNPYQALATIRSSLTYSDKIGPASLQVGGTRTQYPGREQIEQQLPTVSITTGSLALAKWLTWTPAFSYAQSATLHIDQPNPLSTRLTQGSNGQLIDTSFVDRNAFQQNMTFSTPLRIHGFDFRNDVTIRDQVNDFPDEKIVYPHADSSLKELRVFRRTFATTVDWNPTFSMPQLFPSRFKVTPSVGLQNVDPHPFWIRTDLSGGRWVHQSKRLVYGLSTSPAVYGLLPGFGPFERFRHAITPVITYSIAPGADIDNEYLAALGTFRQGYLGALPQSAISLQLSQNIEAKVKSVADTSAPDQQAQKLKILSMQFSSLGYDFERAKAVGRKLAGLTTENFGTTLRSDLLPGFDFAADYSLFEGSTLSDTAQFKPFLTRVTSTFRISQQDNPFAVITRLFGRAVPERSPGTRPSPADANTSLASQVASQPVAGQASRGSQFVVPPSAGWAATFSFSTARPRPATGDRVQNYDPRVRCEQYRNINPFAYDQCVSQPINEQQIPSTTYGGIPIQFPRQTSLSGSLNFALTPKWTTSWQTSYDFEIKQFASHMVSLQRDLHDWRAVFAFTKSPNGNFAFNFFIALKPQPDLKFDYSRASVRGS